MGKTSQLWRPCVPESLSAGESGIPGQLEENQQLSQILLSSENEMIERLTPYCSQTTIGQAAAAAAASGVVQRPITPPIGDLIPNQLSSSVVSPVYFSNGSLQPSPIPLDEPMEISMSSSSLIGFNLGQDGSATGDVNLNLWNVDNLDLTEILGINNFPNPRHA